MLSRKIFENFHSLMAILALLEQVLTRSRSAKQVSRVLNKFELELDCLSATWPSGTGRR